MSRSIDCYFTLASPWAFLGHQPFLDLAKAQNLTIRYKPVDVGEVYPHTGGLPLPKRDPRGGAIASSSCSAGARRAALR
jgi:2-hydroxychromene-2-carboxylate isomerase